MPFLTFSGDFVASQFDLEEKNANKTDVEIEETPFLATDIVRIEIRDSDVEPNGEFDPDHVEFVSFSVERAGVTYEFGVDNGSKIKESGDGSNVEQGDTYFVTNDSISPPSSGPFAGLEEQTYLFSSSTSFADGPGDYRLDRKANHEAGERNGNFNAQSAQVCFATGTRLLTPAGEIPVEQIRAGQTVVTADHGPQPVRLVHRSDHIWSTDGNNDKPILIANGALGAGLPRRALKVSPQHRILIPNPSGAGTVLVPAHFLCSLPGVRRMNGLRRASYYHLVLTRHEILFANYLPTESFFPGPVAMRSLTSAQNRTVRQIMHTKLLASANPEVAPARRFARAAHIRKSLTSNPALWSAERLLRERMLVSAEELRIVS